MLDLLGPSRKHASGPRELRLLEYLVRAAGRTCTRDELHERVWDYRPGFDPGSNVVQVAIMRLRRF